MEIKITIVTLILSIILYTVSMLCIGMTIGIMTNNRVEIEHYHSEQLIPVEPGHPVESGHPAVMPEKTRGRK